jgi:hypothetical protein
MSAKQWTTTIFIIVAAVGLVVAAAPQPKISGRIEIAKPVATPTYVFVIARDELRTGGHPLLAKRLEVKSFPVNFTLGPEDAMMGGALPPRVLLEARVDRDGDAATHEAGAPSASIGGVSPGASNIVLRLK